MSLSTFGSRSFDALTFGAMTLAGREVSPPAAETPSAGAGHPWSAYVSTHGAIRKKRRQDDEIRDAMREAYAEIVGGSNDESKQKAATVVSKFANKKSLDVAIPPHESIDWTRFGYDIEAAQTLLNIWIEWQEIEEEDTLFMLMAVATIH